MIISHPSLVALRTNFSALFQRGYDRGKPFFGELCTTVPSTTRSNTYGFLARVPKMRKWVGPRVAHNLSEKAAVIINDPYELTVEVDRDDIEDDNLGIYAPLMEEMGQSVACHPDDLLKTALQSGTTLEGFDGVAFYSALHVLGNQAAQSNNHNLALTPENYATVRAAMMSTIGEDGDPLGVGEDLVLTVPPQLEAMGRLILNAEMIPNAAGTAAQTNTMKGSARLQVVPKLANQATTWYLNETARAIKPFIFQRRKAAKFVSRTSESDPKVFDEKKFVYGADCRDNVGYALWWLSHRSAP
jgi:phage major head subunit gpT-like protein